MKKLLLLIIFAMALPIAACGDDGNASQKELVLGENAFGVHVTVKKISNEPAKFIVFPHADEFGYDGQSDVYEGMGIFGTDGLIPGRKKGNKAILDGSFTLYANDKSGPSVTIEVKGTFAIDDLDNDFSTMHFYLYDNGKFIKSDRETVNK